ncbi:formyltetrahydrofolate deformylase [Thiothrix subterranea]|uniref:Formyltetrahydrofolate deformylase n=1 Tax=Thiothrix subterranea TaxID=2735563 RepID=A0AA51MP82_9GAMM|nr:formyltetrahydrofolate deformylase [Thiothrix subterranea]MDQ5769189.1 formyltetrahydrofolate deformylase [Thiothrix subterranea]WML87344.1 formyltetrahydrofolate deformylase [Thiothrix subterranea]
MPTEAHYILTVTCPAKTGIVAAVTGFLAESQCYITEMAQYDDEMTQKFFCRIMFRRDSQLSPALDTLRQQFAVIAENFAMQWGITNATRATRVVLMVSKADHCLVDLLYRKNKGDLNMNVVCVVSNHMDLRSLVEREGIRFVCLPVDKTNKAEQEARMLEIVADAQAELVVLARYMQILSDDTCRKLAGMCINIHHSFLPGFKGARPYHQAYDRGVKLIGATAHYVTSDLDEGPIIEQSVERVDHTYQPEDLAALGRDLENSALAKAVRLHIERRVFMDGNKTVVFK